MAKEVEVVLAAVWGNTVLFTGSKAEAMRYVKNMRKDMALHAYLRAKK